MDAAVLNRVDTRAYVQRFLSSSTRPDGRGWEDFRRASVTCGSIGPALGSGMAKLGRTTVLAGVTGRLVGSKSDTPPEDLVEVTAEHQTLCVRGARLRGAVASGALAAWVRTRVACAVDAEVLCAAEGLYWTLELGVYVLDDAGNVRDAALLAAAAALADTTLPAVRAAREDADERVACTVDERERRPLRLDAGALPFACSFAVCGEHVLADPGADEERVADSMLTVLVDAQGALRAVVKPGGVPLPPETIAKCAAVAKRRGVELADILGNRQNA